MEQTNTQIITTLVFQLAVIIFAVRVFGRLAAKAGMPSVLGELLAGIAIGPYALGAVPLPGFPAGLFPLSPGGTAVGPELYAISQIASVILLFSSGLETDLSLFIRYSLPGGIIGLGGVIFSFVLGDAVSMLMLGAGFMDVRCLFLGIMSTATSVGITARILSDRKKMDSPEGVTILAAAVFDDVLGIVLLAVVMGIVSAMEGGGQVSGEDIAAIALKSFGIWLAVTVACILLSGPIARFVRLFGGTIDFSVAALGFSLLLSGFFEKQGLAMIIGSYTAGLALSRTDIAPVIQERIRPLYKFFVPIFFAVMGMSVDVLRLFHADVLLFGALYTAAAVAAKLLGCGGPALALGFNVRGALRIGAGMIPRGEVALIVAGIGLSAGIIDQKLFGVVILMTLATTLLAPPVLSLSLKARGSGTRKNDDGSEAEALEYDFGLPEVSYMALQLLVHNLIRKGFYVQTRNVTDGMFQARKDFISIISHTDGGRLIIQTSAGNALFVRELVYDMLEQLYSAFQMEGRA